MLRMRDIRDSKAAASYYGKTDGGTYYLDSSELRREVGGEGAKLLRLDSSPDFDQFKRLLQGLDPHSGEQLTAKLIDGRLAGWDVTASIPKGVTIALERGDERIHDALWEAGRETMADLEGFIATRERKGGAQENRITGNMIWYGFEHPETRPARDDQMPDPDRHIHFVIPNVTYDHEEKQWKAIKFRPIMDLRKWFDRRFDMRLASKLADLGYGIETKTKSDGVGGKRFFSWDIKDMPASVVKKFSRRAGEVEELATAMKVETPLGRDKLGATSRMHKRDDMTLEDYRRYWDARLTPDEARNVAEVIKAAMLGQNSAQVNTADKGVEFAVGHTFERQSVTRQTDLEITAMERCMGGARPEDILPEMHRQGVLLKDGEATTRDVLAEEGRIIAFAREGRGTMRPLAVLGLSHKEAQDATLSPEQQAVSTFPKSDAFYASTYARNDQGSDRSQVSGSLPSSINDQFAIPRMFASLSSEQQAVCRHVWDSPDQVILVRGAAGTGKTTTTKAIIAGIDRPYAMLAPTAEASRGVLRREGFEGADTVASFLGNREWQGKLKGGVIFIDEAGLLPIKDLDHIAHVSKMVGARLVLMGDPKQHKSVARHGNMFKVLQEFAGLPVAELKDIKRQRGQYKEAVAAIDRGEFLKAHDILDELGYIRQVDGNAALVSDYMDALERGKSVLVVAPTHADGDEITAAIRQHLKEEGKLGTEQTVECLVPLNWTEAQKSDPASYRGDEVIQFFRNSGPYLAGQTIGAHDLLAGGLQRSSGRYAAYATAGLALAPGDTVRITAGGWTADRKHRLNNGNLYTVKGFTEKGDIALTNGWVVRKDFGHMAYGYVSTSHAAQGKTVDRVLVKMGSQSLGAINAEQFYVSLSRARERPSVYTDLPAKSLREAIQRQDKRKSATELFAPKVIPFTRRLREQYARLREQRGHGITQERSAAYGF